MFSCFSKDFAGFFLWVWFSFWVLLFLFGLVCFVCVVLCFGIDFPFWFGWLRVCIYVYMFLSSCFLPVCCFASFFFWFGSVVWRFCSAFCFWMLLRFLRQLFLLLCFLFGLKVSVFVWRCLELLSWSMLVFRCSKMIQCHIVCYLWVMCAIFGGYRLLHGGLFRLYNLSSVVFSMGTVCNS